MGWLQVYFRHKDGSFEALDAINQGQQVYYAYQADDEAFPPVSLTVPCESTAVED